MSEHMAASANALLACLPGGDYIAVFFRWTAEIMDHATERPEPAISASIVTMVDVEKDHSART